MMKRRDDAIYFALILGVAVAGFLASELTSNSMNPSSDREDVDLEFSAFPSDFEFPPIELPQFSFVLRRSVSPRIADKPTRPSTDRIESALLEVRSVLLASSNPTVFVEPE